MFKAIAVIIPVICLMLFTNSSNAQSDSKDNPNIYQVYKNQIKYLFEQRGFPKKEIDELMGFYNGSQELSDESIALLLEKLYPTRQGIGFLFYFFNQDTLHRLFFEPGKLIKHDTIRITRADLLQINTDMNHVLGLYEATDKRAPRLRGLGMKPSPATKSITLKSHIKYSTQILIPDEFSEAYKHLIIVPAMNIGSFPFHILQPFEDSSYLIDKCSFTIAPSLADVFGLRIKLLKELYKYSFNIDVEFNLPLDSLEYILEYPLFISNPTYPTDREYIFPDLPGAKKEIGEALKYADNYKLFEGEGATKDSVLFYLDKTDFAYFATHGIANAENPLQNSFLVLSGKDPYLTAREIMNYRSSDSNNLRFPEMVILSACQTGLGMSVEAGIIGLARSFLLRGSKFVIMSLWSVDDNSTAYLMNRFIHHLIKPNRFTPAEPLRQAILDTKRKFPIPSQWACFSLFGVDF